ncbi:MAG: FtsQ-type POTRA domain-containing protein [Actinomycetota bacterium]|nr:FtsQ-type POTRA domain-containing protein [Actinomycetota bacterium]
MGISILRHRDGSRTRQALIAGIGLAVLVGAAFLISRSPLFGARTIAVKGAGRLSQREVLKLGGVGSGTNLVWLSTAEVAARLEASPWISTATVQKELPSTLRITVHEQSPVLARRSASGFDLLAADGSVLARAKSPRGLPVVSGSFPEQLRAASAALKPMSSWLRSQISSAVVGASGELTLHLGAAEVVTYGPATDTYAKAVALGGIVRWAAAHHTSLGTIDVSAPSAPTARPAGPPTVPVASCHGGQQAPSNCA